MLDELELDLNKEQKDIVLNSLDDSSVVLAGAGSGKTRVIITRTQYLLQEKNIDPKSIVMVTFTNKATQEMKERLCAATPYGEDVFVGTFHNLCTTILRKYGKEMGINKFTIMDKYESRTSLKAAFETCHVVADKSLISKYANKIGHCKNKLKGTQKLYDEASDPEEIQFARVFKAYQDINWHNKTFDFDDLIIYAVYLLFKSNETRDWLQEEIKYIVVDESQDMNPAQYTLLNLLSGANNVCLVGDVDQSIYGFRDAKPELIQKFIDKGVYIKTFKLERNYRSTKNIIEASNEVIKHNKNRPKKTMYCKNETGEPIVFKECKTPDVEGDFIAQEILALIKYNNYNFEDVAILYRTNAQSRAIEDSFIKNNIDYKMVGALSFYERQEIKDALAVLKLYINRKDKNAATRILKYQTGIGKNKTEAIIKMADTSGTSYTGAFMNYIDTAKVNMRLANLDRIFSTPLEKGDLASFTRMAMDVMGYTAKLEKEGTLVAQSRLENLEELYRILKEKDDKGCTLDKFLDEVSLASTKSSDNDNKVTLMTIHSAKGLEYKAVFLCGVEEELLPHRNAMSRDYAIEEERRLIYVAMTRAKKLLYLSRVQYRDNKVTETSRFISEIPKKYLLKC